MNPLSLSYNAASLYQILDVGYLAVFGLALSHSKTRGTNFRFRDHQRVLLTYCSLLHVRPYLSLFRAW
jgi:hypothetical protein